MAMGTTRSDRSQQSMWVSAADPPRGAGYSFYERLNRILEAVGFDTFVEGLRARFYATKMGRPSLAPGRYFRLLLIGYFDGLDSERAIAWRAADSLSVQTFLLRLAPPASFDRKRKKTSNKDWTHPHDPDAKVAKMKDSSTHMAHKVEHAVDMETGARVELGGGGRAESINTEGFCLELMRAS